jgi:class 3 adenylate cyclase
VSLRTTLTAEVQGIFTGPWDTRNATVVPEPESLRLGKQAATLTAAVLYADLAGSTATAVSQPWQFAAEVFKSFLHCAARLVREHGGTITAYDGDRIMALFVGPQMEAAATRAALKLRYAVATIVEPLLRARYPQSGYQLRYGSGLDVSELAAARTGIRGSK